MNARICRSQRMLIACATMFAQPDHRGNVTAAKLAGRLPAISVVRRWSQSLAVLDAIMSPERQYWCFCFDSRFGPDQALASMRNGEGNEYSIVFAEDGAAGSATAATNQAACGRRALRPREQPV